MELDNLSNLQASILPGWSHQGDEQYTLVIKAGYRFEKDGQLTPLEKSRELVSVDEYKGEPEASSVEKAAEMVPFKDGFEILIQGEVEPKPGTTMQSLVASLLRGEKPWWSKKLTLFGPRVWESNLLTGLRPSEPAPLERLPICWEYAFGGIAEDGEARCNENPAGFGWAKRQGQKAKGKPVPQIEGERFIAKSTKEYPPAGFGPIALHWGERAKALETLDKEKAQEGGSPYTEATPKNLYNCAPIDQQLPTPPEPGDKLLLEYWYPDQSEVAIELPIPTFNCVLMADKKPFKKVNPRWDTLLVDTTEQEIHVIFRVSLKTKDLPEKPRLVLAEPLTVEEGAA